MAWKTVGLMELRKEFIEMHAETGNMAAACRQFGISRPVGYKWVKRFAGAGTAGLADKSRRPNNIPHKTAGDVELRVKAVRQAHPTWGPKKVRAHLLRLHPESDWPATSTIGAILERCGLIEPVVARPRVAAWTDPLRHAQAPNDVWSIDFKGQFMLGNGTLCYPLTVTDNFARMVLGLLALNSTATDPVRAYMERVFCDYGLPMAMRSDNGTPFASRGVLGLSALSAWWLSLGITHERIERGHPEQNGRHERMHLTLKEETARPGGKDMAEQQLRFEDFRATFNHVRPHEALGQTPPAEHYRPSPRQKPTGKVVLNYDHCDLKRPVRATGAIRMSHGDVYVGQALAHHSVGLTEVDIDVWLVEFAGHDLGYFEVGEERIEPVSKGRNSDDADDVADDKVEEHSEVL